MCLYQCVCEMYAAALITKIFNFYFMHKFCELNFLHLTYLLCFDSINNHSTT